MPRSQSVAAAPPRLAIPAGLPDEVALALTEFAHAAQGAFGNSLVSIVLFGSAAEGRLRATSDVNVLLVLRSFEKEAIDRIRETTRMAYAAIKLRPMFVLADELPLAAEAFAVKFQDMLTRRVVLLGGDPFAGIVIPRERIVQRLRQISLNIAIRLRATYAVVSLREEQLAREIAEVAAPLRSAAAAILALEGRPAASPKAAFEQLTAELPDGPWDEVLAGISDARDDAALPPGVGPKLLLRLIALARALHQRIERITA